MMMLRAALLACLVLTACGREAPEPAPVTASRAPPTAEPWVLCDGIDAPLIDVLTRGAAEHTVTVASFDKTTGAQATRADYEIGASEGAAGGVYTALLQNGAEVGHVRQLNPGMLETPGAAYTIPFTSVRIGERTLACRWIARTRLAGFTARRSIVISEDADGDLIYTTYDFADAGRAQTINLSESSRSTTFSLEIRGGAETLGPEGAAYRFENAGHVYTLTASRDGSGRIAVTRSGETVVDEPLIAFQTGDAAAMDQP